MQFSIVAILTALAIGSNASSVAQYNGYNDTSCNTPNGNAVNVVDSATVGSCTMIHDFSLKLVTINSGCMMEVYDDTMCTANNRTLPMGSCFSNEGRPIQGYLLKCQSVTGQ